MVASKRSAGAHGRRARTTPAPWGAPHTASRWYRFPLIALYATVSASSFSQSDRVHSDHVQARLVSEVTKIAPHTGFWIGLHMKIKPGWHTYWKNPGDSGLATRIDWELPEGMVAGAIRWPVPSRFRIGGLMNYGYSDEVVLLTRMSAWPPIGTTPRVVLAANANWIVCEDICIAQEGRFELNLSSASGAPVVDPEGRARIAEAARRLPQPTHGQAQFRASAKAIRLHVPLPPTWPRNASEWWFYPERYGDVQHATKQSAKADRNGIMLTLARGELKHENLERLRGVLVLRYGNSDQRGISVDAQPDRSEN